MPRLRARQWLPPLTRLVLAVAVLAAILMSALAAPVAVVEARPAYAALPDSVNCQTSNGATCADPLNGLAEDGQLTRCTTTTTSGSQCDYYFTYDPPVAGNTSITIVGRNQLNPSSSAWVCVYVYSTEVPAGETAFCNSSSTSNGDWVIVGVNSSRHYTAARVVVLGTTTAGTRFFEFDAPRFSGTQPTRTPTPTSTNTPSPTVAAPTATNTPIGGGAASNPLNRITDGNMEFANADLNWDFADGAMQGRDYPGAGDVQPYCGNGLQRLGGNLGANSPTFYRTMTQNFDWVSGTTTAFVRFQVHGDPGVHTASGAAYIEAYVVDINSGQRFEVAGGQQVPNTSGWTNVQASFTLPNGEYQLVFEARHSGFVEPKIFLDDVWVGTEARSHCSPVVTNTPTPTRTPTGAATATAAPLSNTNCGFESGSAGWTGSNYALFLAGGPNGSQYAYLLNSQGRIGRPFGMNSPGYAYFTFWVGPGSYGELVVRNLSTNGVNNVVWTGNNATGAWRKYTVSRLLNAGNHFFEFRSYSTFAVDGITVSRNSFTNCLPDPTPGPTSFVTATVTRTPTPGNTPTGTPTNLATATRTPNNTQTPAPTSTPQPTSTATSTPGNDATATSQAATATSAAVTATINAAASATAAVQQTQSAPPPPQPEPAPSAECVRPTSALNIPAWIDYEVCRVLTWVLWNDTNTQQALELQEIFDGYEPMGTWDEINQARDVLEAAAEAYDWEQGTGLVPPDFDLSFFTPDGPPEGTLFGDGTIDLQSTPSGSVQLLSTCTYYVANAFGAQVGRGICMVINFVRDIGVLGWMQYFWDLGVWILFIRAGWRFITVQLPQLL